MSDKFSILYLDKLHAHLVDKIEKVDKILDKTGCDQFLEREFRQDTVSGEKVPGPFAALDDLRELAIELYYDINRLKFRETRY